MLGDMLEIARHVHDPSATGGIQGVAAKTAELLPRLFQKLFALRRQMAPPLPRLPFAVISTPHGEQYWPAFTCTAIHDGFRWVPSQPTKPNSIHPLPSRKCKQRLGEYHR